MPDNPVLPAESVPLPTTLWVFVHDACYEGLPEHGREAADEAVALWGRCMDDLRFRGYKIVPACGS